MISRLLSLQDFRNAQRFYQAEHWRHYTMYQRLAHWAALRPEAPALQDSASVASYRELLSWVDTYAEELSRSGLKLGDRVAIWAPSRLESVMALLACSRMGYVCVPSLHRDHTPDEVFALLERTRASALVVQRCYGANVVGRDVANEARALPNMKHVVVCEPLIVDGGGSTARFGGLAPRPVHDLPFSANPDRIMYMAFTSGTTGRPKGVMHTDNTLLSNGRAIAADFGFNVETVVYTLSPMSHNMGTVCLVTALACGAKLVVHGPLDANRALARIRSTGATYLVGVPTHGIDLMARISKNDTLGNVAVFQLAGSPVPPRLAQALINRGVHVQNCFGMTENCSFLYTRADDPVDVITKTCGRCSVGMEVSVWDTKSSDRRLPDGVVGELGVRGASMMLGYFDDQTATEMAFNAEGWFMTGDLGFVDENGNVNIVGRKKDLIIRGGHNIHPAKVEDLAMRLPAVSKAAAFPVTDDRLGERMCLALIASTETKLDPTNILTHLASLGLSVYDMPEYIIQMTDFPLTASGKILKRELAEMAADGRISPNPVRWSPSEA